MYEDGTASQGNTCPYARQKACSGDTVSPSYSFLTDTFRALPVLSSLVKRSGAKLNITIACSADNYSVRNREDQSIYRTALLWPLGNKKHEHLSERLQNILELGTALLAHFAAFTRTLLFLHTLT